MKTHFALVTGASSGIGLEFAKQLAKRGYNLLIVSNVPQINEAAEEIKKGLGDEGVSGLEVIPLVMDLSQQSSARELYDYTHAQEIEIEVLVNNAGVYHDRDILDDSEAFTSLILNLHMYTPAMLCYLFGQDMRELGTYASTKSFLSAFTRSLHIELHEYGVHVTDVSPGAVDTGLFSIPQWVTKAGKALGIIASPQMLVRRALRALFRGCSKTTIPTVFWQVLCFIILLIPTCVLRWIRKFGWF